MKELLEYRAKLLEQIKDGADAFCETCKSFDDAHEKVEGDWTVHQLAAHTRDVELYVYGQRIRRTLNEDVPVFSSFDADAWMAEHYKRDEPLETILNEFAADVKNLCETLADAPEGGWSRLSGHESMGGDFTLQVWVERSLAHIEEHLLTLKNAKKR